MFPPIQYINVCHRHPFNTDGGIGGKAEQPLKARMICAAPHSIKPTATTVKMSCVSCFHCMHKKQIPVATEQMPSIKHNQVDGSFKMEHVWLK